MEQDRETLCQVCLLLYQRGYVVSNDGNVSVRIGEDQVLITPSGVSKGRLTPDMLVVCDLEGRVLAGRLHPSSESAMHLLVYRERINPSWSALTAVCGAALILMGNSDDEYRRTLEEIAAKCGAAERLRFLPPVPVNEIWKYAGAMDVGIMPIENLCLSYYYTLPNKFFENVQSLTPVICSDLPEMHRLVDEYGIGLICEPENVDDLAQCLERMRTDREFYNSCKQNLLRAKRELCWEREKTVLLDAYRKYLL